MVQKIVQKYGVIFGVRQQDSKLRTKSSQTIIQCVQARQKQVNKNTKQDKSNNRQTTGQQPWQRTFEETLALKNLISL